MDGGVEGRIQNSVGGRGTDLRGFIVMAMKRSLLIVAGESEGEGEAREAEQEEKFEEELVVGRTLRVYGRGGLGLVESPLLLEVDEYAWCCCGCCMIVCLSGDLLLI